MAIYQFDDTGDIKIGEIGVGVTMSPSELLRKRYSSPVTIDKREVEEHLQLIANFVNRLRDYRNGELKARLQERA